MPESRKRRTQAERSAASDKAMFKAAIKIIARDGPTAMTVAGVGEAAGFSAGLVTYRFGTKSNLLVETAKRILELWQRRVLGPGKAMEGSLEGIRTTVRLYFESVGGKSDLMMAQYRLMMASFGTLKELQPAFRAYDRKIRKDFAEQIRQAISNGSANPAADPDLIALILIGQVRGIALQYFIDSRGVNIEDATEATIKIIDDVLAI